MEKQELKLNKGV